MADKILDCSKLSDDMFERVRSGFEHFMYDEITNSRERSVFGRVDKYSIKDLTRYLKYTDKRTLIKGGILGAGAVWVGSKIKKLWGEHKEEIIQKLGSKMETEEESE